MSDDNKCGHKLCTCASDGDTGYCSSQCKEAVDQSIDQIACDCGHGNCG